MYVCSEKHCIHQCVGLYPPANAAVNFTYRICVAGSGFIDFDEFVAVMNEFMPADDSDQIRQAFSMMDRDGSGKISAAELKQVMRSIGERLTDDDIDEIIREIDMDGDGEVDYEGWW